MELLRLSSKWLIRSLLLFFLVLFLVIAGTTVSIDFVAHEIQRVQLIAVRTDLQNDLAQIDFQLDSLISNALSDIRQLKRMVIRSIAENDFDSLIQEDIAALMADRENFLGISVFLNGQKGIHSGLEWKSTSVSAEGLSSFVEILPQATALRLVDSTLIPEGQLKISVALD
jgi:hypothetical protein